MNLGELLQELRENILHDRSDQVAGQSDYLWSDTTLCRYIDEAQRRFARGALVIRDGTTSTASSGTTTKPVTDVLLVAGTDMYTLHPSVLAVISARLDGDKADLARGGHAAFATYTQPDTYYFDPSSLSQLPPGKPLAYDTDEYAGADANGSFGTITLRVYPVPNADYAGQNISLRVARMPLQRFTLANLEVEPEIPEEHHLEMLDWAAYLALRIVDVDAGMPDRANEFRQSFELHVQKAKEQALRKTFTPLQWNFGRNGFSWEH